jgi:hypothetical protein
LADDDDFSARAFTFSRALAAIDPIVDSSEQGVILKMLTNIWSGLGMPIGLPLVGGLARLVGIFGGLACLGVILYLYLGHSYALHPNAQSRSDSILLCRIAANERLYVEGCRD